MSLSEEPFCRLMSTFTFETLKLGQIILEGYFVIFSKSSYLLLGSPTLPTPALSTLCYWYFCGSAWIKWYTLDFYLQLSFLFYFTKMTFQSFKNYLKKHKEINWPLDLVIVRTRALVFLLCIALHASSVGLTTPCFWRLIKTVLHNCVSLNTREMGKYLWSIAPSRHVYSAVEPPIKG